jgi:hypothetical protein
MQFGYLRDPLFLVCFVIYWTHRVLASNGWSTELLRAHLNDLICVPFFVPMMVWASWRLGMRRHDGPPDAIEIVIPLIIWSALFEVVIPLHEEWHVPTVADPKDVLAYSVGALIATVFWQSYYRTSAGRRE